MLIVGLTGGIASGKNFVANYLRKYFKVPIFDADLEVHKILQKDRYIFQFIKNNFPLAVKNDVIDRKLLGKEVFLSQEKLSILENAIYPILRNKENLFLKNCYRQRKKIIVLNIPLLFEKGSYKRCDQNICLIASKKTQFYRFQKRFIKENHDKNIDKKSIKSKFITIYDKQMKNLYKKKLSNFIIFTGINRIHTIKQIKTIFNKLI